MTRRTPAWPTAPIETPDDKTVVFHLNQPDLTFMKVLSTATASIVDEDTFPADALMGDAEVIGSGPYMLSQYKPGEQGVLEVNPEYTGPREPQAEQVFVKYFAEAACAEDRDRDRAGRHRVAHAEPRPT